MAFETLFNCSLFSGMRSGMVNALAEGGAVAAVVRACQSFGGFLG